MRVATELNGQARRWREGEIVRHQSSGAAIEGEGRAQHAAIPNRHQPLEAPRILLANQRDGVTPNERRTGLGESCEWQGCADGFPQRSTL